MVTSKFSTNLTVMVSCIKVFVIKIFLCYEKVSYIPFVYNKILIHLQFFVIDIIF